jgi:uncharacterized membrane protein YdjX (TVP38/TMEM64 family)
MKASRYVLVLAIAAIIGAFFYFDLAQYLTFESLKASQAEFQSFYAENGILTIGIYFVVYVAVTALSLPGAAIMTLAGGMLFGFWTGTVIVSFASTIGATLAFLASRFLLRDWVQGKFGEKLKAINAGIEREGAIYLFSLRLIPAFPFFVINLVMGLTPIKVSQYFLVSQIGMLPGTAVYVNAGTQIAQLDSPAGIISLPLLASFALLGLFPLIVKKAMNRLKRRTNQ